jgi:hypothetical protein
MSTSFHYKNKGGRADEARVAERQEKMGGTGRLLFNSLPEP